MAGAKETPRQKMIGMLYLVLTALLALNVSKDILEAFVVVNEGLEMNLGNYEEKNHQLYAEFDLAKSVDQKKAKPYWESAQEIREASRELDLAIRELKVELISKTEAVPLETARKMKLEDISRKDNYDVPTNIMIGNKEDASNGQAAELRAKIEAFRGQVSGILEGYDLPTSELGLNMEDENGLEGQNWENHNFYHTPLAGTVTILSKLQNDIRNAEYHAAISLLSALDADRIPFDTIAARVMPVSNYVLQGEEYKAEVFLAAYSKTKDPQMLLGTLNENGELVNATDSLEVQDGMGLMNVRTNREGVFTYEGVINYPLENGETRSFPFRSEYIVAKPSLVVSPTKMNVLYRGIENDISISVPGVPSENIQASVTGGHQLIKVRNGVYKVKMKARSPKEVSVQVSAKMADGSTRNMGAMKFRAKRLPKPHARFAGKEGSAKLTSPKITSARGLSVVYDDDFAYDLTAKVVSFRMTGKYKNKIFEPTTRGNLLTDEMKTILKSVPRNTQIIFDKIKAVGSDGIVHELAPIVITKI